MGVLTNRYHAPSGDPNQPVGRSGSRTVSFAATRERKIEEVGQNPSSFEERMIGHTRFEFFIRDLGRCGLKRAGETPALRTSV